MTERKDPLRRLHCRPGFLLKRCHQVAAAIFLEECRAFDMTTSQYGALAVLKEFPGIDQLTMARLAGQDRSTAGLVVKLLDQRELIERTVDPIDKRRMSLRLSAKGEALLADIAPAAERAQQRVLAGLHEDSRDLFLQLMDKFLAGHGAVIDV